MIENEIKSLRKNLSQIRGANDREGQLKGLNKISGTLSECIDSFDRVMKDRIFLREASIIDKSLEKGIAEKPIELSKMLLDEFDKQSVSVLQTDIVDNTRSSLKKLSGFLDKANDGKWDDFCKEMLGQELEQSQLDNLRGQVSLETSVIRYDDNLKKLKKLSESVPKETRKIQEMRALAEENKKIFESFPSIPPNIQRFLEKTKTVGGFQLKDLLDDKDLMKWIKEHADLKDYIIRKLG